jgi:hypothetical protein
MDAVRNARYARGSAYGFFYKTFRPIPAEGPMKESRRRRSLRLTTSAKMKIMMRVHLTHAAFPETAYVLSYCEKKKGV